MAEILLQSRRINIGLVPTMDTRLWLGTHCCTYGGTDNKLTIIPEAVVLMADLKAVCL